VSTTLNNQLTQSKMNAESIATYISNLEKDNAALRKLLQQCEEEKAILEYESMLHYAQVSDDESVASDSDSSTMAQITGGEPYESDSDSEYEPTEYKPFSESDSETDSAYDSEYEADSDVNDDDFFVCHNYDMMKAFDEIADQEENKYKRHAYQKAANIIYEYPSKITSGEQISHVNGIGKGIIQKIDKFLETGNSCTFVTNDNIAEKLELLAQVQENDHKSEAYEKAADAIRKLKFEVTNGTEISQGPRKVPGVGKGIANKIDEYIATGEIRELSIDRLMWQLNAINNIPRDENLGRLNIGPRPVVK